MHRAVKQNQTYHIGKIAISALFFLALFMLYSIDSSLFNDANFELLTLIQTGLVLCVLAFKHTLAHQIFNQMDIKKSKTSGTHHMMRFAGVYIVAMGAVQHDNIMYVMGLSMIVIDVMIWQLIQTKIMLDSPVAHSQTLSFKHSGRASIMLNINYIGIFSLSSLWVLHLLTKGFAYNISILNSDDTIDFMMMLCVFITIINLKILRHMITLQRISCAELD